MMRASSRREAAMAHVQDVAAYILGEQGPMTAMKLQKLCYYSYGYHLAWEERRLFPERFEAWANGPVCPELYQIHRGRLELRPGDVPGNPAALDRGEKESVNLVLGAYGDLTAHQLSSMTHREPPWVHARARAGVAPLDRSNEPLDDDEIFEFFDALTSADADVTEG
jgi:uncharacterized phage-associated protein